MTRVGGKDRMKVLVVRQDDTFVIIAQNCTSPITKLEGNTAIGNPYSLYGDACAKFTGINKYELSIVVADCTSGNLEGLDTITR